MECAALFSPSVMQSQNMPANNYPGFDIFRTGINETMSSQARGHRLLWVTSKVKAAVRAHCFRSCLTTLFLSIICAASSIAFVAGLRYQSLASSALRLRRQDDLVMIHAIC
jgi:hypothetical protein